MKIIVLIKPVPDLNKLKVSRSKGQVIETGKRVLNSWDRSALQLASELKNTHGGSIRGRRRHFKRSLCDGNRQLLSVERSPILWK